MAGTMWIPGLLSCNVVPQETPMAITFTRNIGMTVLGLWLILSGMSGLVLFPLPPPIMAVLALVAGVLILIGR
jgi:hypothetical protein